MESHELQVIREVLEGTLSPDHARAVLFAALSAVDQTPATTLEWLSFTENALRDELFRRTDSATAHEIETQLRQILGKGSPKKRRSDAPTMPFPTHSGPTRALVCAATASLGRRLKATMGQNMVVMSIGDFGRFTDLVYEFSPQLLIIDGSEPPKAGLEKLPSLVSHLEKDAVIVLYDDNEAEFSSLCSALESGPRKFVRINRREDARSLLDLIAAMSGRGSRPPP